MTDDRKHPHNDDLPAPHDSEPPADNLPQFEGRAERLPPGREAFLYDGEDLSNIAAEVAAFARLHPRLDDGDAAELAGMVYDLLTGEWMDEDVPTDGDSDYRITD